VDLDPDREVLEILGIELEAVEVEPALRVLLVVALEAVLLDKGLVLEADGEKEGDDHEAIRPLTGYSRSD
jgi:hypothetical protein